MHNKEKIEKLIDEEIQEEAMAIDNPPHDQKPDELMHHYQKKGRLIALRQSFERLDR